MVGDVDLRRAVEADVQAKLAAQAEGPIASPSVAYIKYIMQDEYVPENLPPSLRAVIYDKELALTNIKDEEMTWVRLQYILAEIMFKTSRPALACNHKEEINLAVIPAKLLVKLARSRDGGFERKQQTTQTVIKRVETTTSMPIAKKSRWRVFGRGKKE